MPREHEGRSFWCRACRVQADGEFDDHGRPLGWYKIQNYGSAGRSDLPLDHAGRRVDVEGVLDLDRPAAASVLP
jgi:hypothetical protein